MELADKESPAMPPDYERNKMKTIILYTAAAAAAGFLSLASASPAFGAPSAAQSEKTFEGSVTAVDVPDNTLAVKGWFLTRNFNLGHDCKVTLQDKPIAALSDLRPGQQVDIRYQNDNGVLIATGIAQHDMVLTGHIASINPAARTLVLKHGVGNRDFAIAPDCAVVMRASKTTGLNNLQIGDAVNVVYEPVNGTKTAYRIEQNSATFAGTVETIDSSARLVKVRDAHNEKKFTLADNCPIVINNKLNDSMSSLQDRRAGSSCKL